MGVIPPIQYNDRQIALTIGEYHVDRCDLFQERCTRRKHLEEIQDIREIIVTN
jgi:hypothetical protein